MNIRFVKIYDGLVSIIPTQDSPYITFKMFEAYENNLYILSEKLEEYYSEKDIRIIKWVHHWLKSRTSDIDMFITIMTAAYIPMCIGIGTADNKNPWVLLIILTIVMILILVGLIYEKKYYQFHFDIIEAELKNRNG